MNALVTQVMETLHLTPERQDLTLDIRELADAEADPVLLKQVWLNLVTDALKFTRRCENARIEVGSRFQIKSRGTWNLPRDPETYGVERKPGTVCYVRDNGVGFDMAGAYGWTQR